MSPLWKQNRRDACSEILSQRPGLQQQVGLGLAVQCKGGYMGSVEAPETSETALS